MQAIHVMRASRPYHFLLQFLVEAVCICLVGGLIGVGLTWALAAAVALAAPAFPIVFSPLVVVVSVVLAIGVGVVSFALATGVPIGILSALYPRLGRVLMRVVDVLMAFPSLLLALGLIVILGQGVTNAILAIGVIYLTTTARIVYGVTLRLREETYVEAARSMGAGTLWTIRKHILPNMVSPLLVQASFVFAFAQLGAASLDFLGLGAPPDVPSWGNMLAESRIFITRAPWLLFFPGAAIALTAFSLNLLGDVLRDRLDPRFREMLGNRQRR